MPSKWFESVEGAAPAMAAEGCPNGLPPIPLGVRLLPRDEEGDPRTARRYLALPATPSNLRSRPLSVLADGLRSTAAELGSMSPEAPLAFDGNRRTPLAGESVPLPPWL